MTVTSFPPLAAVIGHPVRHSLSPLIFATLSGREKQPIDYRMIDVAPEDFSEWSRLAGKLGLFLGWNVTIPHKQAAARLCDSLSREARASGAVNVIRFDRGRMRGFNTDILGVERTLEVNRFRVGGARAVIFGAGGAALAAAYALAKGGAREVCFVNRTLERARGTARKLARACGASTTRFHAAPWSSTAGFGREIDLYVNATPLGMAGSGGPSARDFFPRAARKGAFALDLVYVPEQTPFLRQARKRGLRAVGGLDMLIWQAIATWEIWFGELGHGRSRVLKTALERVLRAELRRRRSAS